MSGGKVCTNERMIRDRTTGRKIAKIGELVIVVPNDIIHNRISLAGGAGKIGAPRFLQIVYQPEEIVFCRTKPVGGAVGDTKEFYGVVADTSLYGPVSDGADLDDPFGSVEFRGGVGVGQRGSGDT